MKSNKRSMMEVDPNIRVRIRDIAKESGFPIKLVHQTILEGALPDYESGRKKLVATVAKEEASTK